MPDKRPKWCNKCYGHGIYRSPPRTGKYVKCECGRLMDSWGTSRWTKQEKEEKRFQEIMHKGWI